MAKKSSNGKDLVIVESPAKARTVGRFLGSSFDVKASMGHVRDLPQRELGVDIEHDFEPTYVDVSDRKSVLSEIKKAARQAANVYLATDPDREGEAISWHLVQAAGLNGSDNLKRVVFHEITKNAIDEAFEHPRSIDMQLVNAQQARRILDRIVGYKLSPILWSKIRRGLSAGRVQSVALRLIVDREREIEAFKPEEYWVISADLEKDEQARFTATLHAIPGEKGRPKISDGQTAEKIRSDLLGAKYSVASVVRKETKQRPQPPFTTSTMQQEAARRLGFGAQRTMRAAQQLYEGVQLGGDELVGLITYMRTDSTNLSQSALAEANDFIKKQYGPEYADKPRTYRTRSRNAQEAHEAIRPTSIARTPESLARLLNRDQMRLYELVWKRMIASQMKDAVLDSTTVDIAADSSNGQYTMRATGSVIKFAGFRTVYIEGRDENPEDDNSRELPPLNDGDGLRLQAADTVKADQKFTQPPPRYSEAALIRTLEEKGIGRPSTYASIVGTIESREYVAREQRRFKPTVLGTAVSDFLVKNFPDIMDPGFTADMENRLDAIASGEQEWIPMLEEFFTPFDNKLEDAKKVDRVPRNLLDEKTNESCEVCEAPMVIKSGRFGKFLSCSRFPDCTHTRPIVSSTGVACPKCKEEGREGGVLMERKNRKGRTFYGCSLYPDCDFLVGRKPLPNPCPDCEGLVIQRSRNSAICTNEECGWKGTVREVTAEGEEDSANEPEPVEA